MPSLPVVCAVQLQNAYVAAIEPAGIAGLPGPSPSFTPTSAIIYASGSFTITAAVYGDTALPASLGFSYASVPTNMIACSAVDPSCSTGAGTTASCNFRCTAAGPGNYTLYVGGAASDGSPNVWVIQVVVVVSSGGRGVAWSRM